MLTMEWVNDNDGRLGAVWNENVQNRLGEPKIFSVALRFSRAYVAAPFTCACPPQAGQPLFFLFAFRSCPKLSSRRSPPRRTDEGSASYFFLLLF